MIKEYSDVRLEVIKNDQVVWRVDIVELPNQYGIMLDNHWVSKVDRYADARRIQDIVAQAVNIVIN